MKQVAFYHRHCLNFEVLRQEFLLEMFARKLLFGSPSGLSNVQYTLFAFFVLVMAFLLVTLL